MDGVLHQSESSDGKAKLGQEAAHLEVVALVWGVGTGLAGGAVIALIFSSIALLPDASELHAATLVLASQVCDQAQAAGWEVVRSQNACEVKTSYRTGSRFVTLLGHKSAMRIPYVQV
jgi:hypothetical protein